MHWNLILDFIWNKKTRLHQQVLQRLKALGRMVLPHFHYYYWATNIRNLNFWVNYGDTEIPPSWLILEANSVHTVLLKAVLYSPLFFSISGYTNNVIVASSFKIWTKIRHHFGLQALSTGAPLAALLLDSTFST